MNSIGRVVSVTYDKIIFNVPDILKLNYNFAGDTYLSDGIGEYVTIVNDYSEKFVYQVVKIEDKEIFLNNSENSKIDYIAKFECIPIGVFKNKKINFNIKSYPHLNNKVYLTSNGEYNAIYNYNINNETSNFVLGKTKERYPISVDVKKLFEHHSAILGNTGSGKSTTLRNIITNTNDLNAANLNMFVFDVHNEYELDFAQRIDVLNDFKINPSDLNLQDWINLVKPSDLVQLPLLQTALKITCLLKEKSISLIALKCYLAYTLYNSGQTEAVAKRTKIIGILTDTNVDTSKYSSQYGNLTPNDENLFLKELREGLKVDGDYLTDILLQKYIQDVDYRANSIEDLSKGLEYAFLIEECKGNSAVRSHCNTLTTRINALNSRYATIFDYNESLTHAHDKNVVVYDVSELDSDLLTFISSYILKEKFEANRKVELSERNINVFLFEEAHRYISKNLEFSQFHELELFKKISREGRKFGCFMLLSSQRPSELSSTVLSQCNNYLIHRIKNNIDIEYMNRTIPYIDNQQLKRITYLPTGTLILIGELYPISVEVDVDEGNYTNSSSTPTLKF